MNSDGPHSPTGSCRINPVLAVWTIRHVYGLLRKCHRYSSETAHRPCCPARTSVRVLILRPTGTHQKRIIMPPPHVDHLRLNIRMSHDKPDHHLWNNNGTYWINFTVRSKDGSTQRIRRSLKTGDVEKARTSRDRILHALHHASGRIAG